LGNDLETNLEAKYKIGKTPLGLLILHKKQNQKDLNNIVLLNII